MAMTKCRECGKAISSKAKVCPHCGAPIEHTIEDVASAGVGGCIVLFVVAAALFWLFGTFLGGGSAGKTIGWVVVVAAVLCVGKSRLIAVIGVLLGLYLMST